MNVPVPTYGAVPPDADTVTVVVPPLQGITGAVAVAVTRPTTTLVEQVTVDVPSVIDRFSVYPPAVAPASTGMAFLLLVPRDAPLVLFVSDQVYVRPVVGLVYAYWLEDPAQMGVGPVMPHTMGSSRFEPAIWLSWLPSEAPSSKSSMKW